jgi:hypothetical protein
MISFGKPIDTVRGSSPRELKKMEIGPVAGVRIAPMVRSKEADLGLTDVHEVEHSTRSGDEIYIPSGTKAASGYEDDEDKYEDLEESLDEESRVRPVGIGKISRFA